jgi:hypothetical protein
MRGTEVLRKPTRNRSSADRTNPRSRMRNRSSSRDIEFYRSLSRQIIEGFRPPRLWQAREVFSPGAIRGRSGGNPLNKKARDLLSAVLPCCHRGSSTTEVAPSPGRRHGLRGRRVSVALHGTPEGGPIDASDGTSFDARPKPSTLTGAPCLCVKDRERPNV